MVLATLFRVCFAESFINNFEYGEMLYKNPRGIGCDKCHGKYGEGMLLGKYKKNDKLIEIYAPSLQKSDVKEIKESLSKKRKKSVMPEYFLTDGEIEALVFYLRKVNETGSGRLK